MIVRGNSGFRIDLIDNNVIRKSAVGPGFARLKIQIEKQKLFHDTLQTDDIKTAKILNMVETTDGFYADMDFISANDFVQFLSEAGRKSLDRFLVRIIAYVKENVSRSRDVNVKESLLKKLAELEQKGVPANYITAARNLCGGEVIIPIGPCHGDLTLSNILFDDEQLYLLDFLDAFVESPIQDVAKLRQDTCFAWSLQMYESHVDATKVQIALQYLDQRIVAAFSPCEWYRRHYKLFQLVNLMRVLPYTKDSRKIVHLRESIARLLEVASS